MNIIIIGLCLLLYVTGFATAYIIGENKYQKLLHNPWGYCDQKCEECTNQCELYNLIRNK